MILFTWFLFVNWRDYSIVKCMNSFNTWNLSEIINPGVAYLGITIAVALVGFICRSIADEF